MKQLHGLLPAQNSAKAPNLSHTHSIIHSADHAYPRLLGLSKRLKPGVRRKGHVPLYPSPFSLEVLCVNGGTLLKERGSAFCPSSLGSLRARCL